MTCHPVPCFLRERLAQGQKIAHEPPAQRHRQISHVAQKSVVGQLLEGLDPLNFGPSHEDMDALRPSLQRSGRIVKGRRPGAQHRHDLAAHRAKVDRITGMVAPCFRQIRDEVGHPPAPETVDAVGQNDLPGVKRFRCGSADFDRDMIGMGMNRHHRRGALNRQSEHLLVPAKVLCPHAFGNLAHGLPGGSAELCLVPALKGQRRDVEVGARHLFRRAQGFHPGIGVLWAALPRRRGIYDRKPVDPFPQKLEPDGQPALPGTHNQDV